jgi:hypothetical protein
MRGAVLIYVAGPYTASNSEEIEINTARAIDAGIQVFKKGHFPYIPHLTHFVDQRARATQIHLTWSDFIAWDLPWLELCDGLLYLGPSKGADLELSHAKRLEKKVFMSLSDLPSIDRPAAVK